LLKWKYCLSRRYIVTWYLYCLCISSKESQTLQHCVSIHTNCCLIITIKKNYEIKIRTVNGFYKTYTTKYCWTMRFCYPVIISHFIYVIRGTGMAMGFDWSPMTNLIIYYHVQTTQPLGRSNSTMTKRQLFNSETWSKLTNGPTYCFSMFWESFSEYEIIGITS